MPAVISREELKDYCLRKLGAPVIDINVDDDQVDDRIDDALAMFSQFHMDGTEKIFLAHTVTASDVTNKYVSLDTKATGTLTLTSNVSDGDTVTIGSNVYTFKTSITGKDHVLIGGTASDSLDNLIDAIVANPATVGTAYGNLTKKHARVTAVAGAGDTMDVTAIIAGSDANSIDTLEDSSVASWAASRLSGGVSIQSVVRVLPVNNNLGVSGNIFNQAFNQKLHDFTRGGGDGILDFMIGSRHINTMSDVLGRYNTIHFNKVQSKVFIEEDWTTDLPEGTILVFEAYRVLNPEENPEIYDDNWLKDYATALIKRQWGSNLKKFSGTTLPGGITINGQEIFDEGSQAIEALETELRDTYTGVFEDQIG